MLRPEWVSRTSPVTGAVSSTSSATASVGTDTAKRSLVPGAEHLTIQLRDALEAKGVFGSVFCDPATPRNRSLVRFTLNADLSSDDLERIARVCAEVRSEVDIEQWPQSRPQRMAA